MTTIVNNVQNISFLQKKKNMHINLILNSVTRTNPSTSFHLSGQDNLIGAYTSYRHSFSKCNKIE